MDLKLGIFMVPDPYQWRFFDTWTLLAYVAGRTERVRLLPDVLNLPLRLPSSFVRRLGEKTAPHLRELLG
jgi:alkanesulfonate monooxygenase SsuD/methylene tetrahydromethanopterin reductase-like flavin-dependent oxidoreductase (luciferase family)